MAEDVELAPLTTLGIGGRARWYIRAASRDGVRSALAWAAERGIEAFVLGGGSNLVVSDRGWPGLVLHVGITGTGFVADGDGTLVTAGAGESWDGVAAAAVSRGLSGVECLSGIPGTVGGTPVQNVGAYGQEVSGVIDHVTVFDRATGQTRDLAAAECGFGYRTSRFKEEDAGRFVVCEVAFRLRPGAPTVGYPDLVAHLERRAIMSASVADVREAVLAIRRRKGMVLDPSDPDTRSVGSFFMNPIVPASAYADIAARVQEPVPSFPAGHGHVKVPAAWLIAHALRRSPSPGGEGMHEGEVGRASLSTKHPLAITNRGGATAGDVVALAAQLKRRVADRFGISLRPEPVFVGFGADAGVAYLLEE